MGRGSKAKTVRVQLGRSSKAPPLREGGRAGVAEGRVGTGRGAVYTTTSVQCDWAGAVMRKPLANVWAGAVTSTPLGGPPWRL